MLELTQENFEAEVLQSEMPVVVDIWGPKCGPCLALMPNVEDMAGEYEGKVKFCKLNVSGNRRLVMSLKVMAVPTFLFYDKGDLKAKITGEEVNIDAIRERADSLIGG